MSNITTLLDSQSVPESRAALICPSRNETYTYKRLRNEMNRVGLGLLSVGVKKGDRACIYLDSSPEYLISYFAIWRIGAVAVPTNSVDRGKELLHVINDAGAGTVITDPQGAGIIGTIRKDAPPVSHIICTGDHLRWRPVPLPVVWEAFDKRYHIPVANSYGLSETIVIGSITTTLPEYPHLTKGYQSVGVAVGYTEIRIVNPGDPEQELPSGVCGEVALRGPAVAKGYWNLPEATREVFRRDGWFLNRNIGYLDPDGILCITDRKMDMIMMSGWKVYPTEVENVIIQHPAVADVAVLRGAR